MATFERAMIRNRGPMSVTGSNHKASQEITIITAAGMADLKKIKKTFGGNISQCQTVFNYNFNYQREQ